MDSYSDEHEYGPEHIPMFKKVVDMFDGEPDFQQIVRLGILANMGYNLEYDDTGAEDYDFDFDRWVPRPNRSGVHGYGFSGNRMSSSSPQPRPHYHGATNTNAGNLGASKEEEKAEKKRLKRQKRKERKRSEKQKEEQNADKNKEETDKKKPENEKPKPDVKEQAAAKDSGGSEDDLSDEDLSGCEELDLTSSFVNKARCKLEQKPKPEKKIPAKEPKSSPDKPKRDAEAEKKPACPSSQTVEDNIQISTRLANLGNTYASAGDFKKAVQFYTDAIKHNPREYKLFGNRSFCFERMRLYMKALDDAELSLGMCPGWVKGLFRKGKALAGLKRYEEAERAFRQVLEVDSSCADATLELMRVQIAQVMGYGYTLEQSAKALNTHKSVKKALHFLDGLNHQPANMSSVSISSPKHHNAAEAAVQDKHSPPASQNSHQQKELYPIWVGNVFCSVTESSLEKLFNKVGPVDSVRLLTYKRCAFVNFTKREDCKDAIRRFNGFDFNGAKLAVRYPDRIPPGMGISSSALTS